MTKEELPSDDKTKDAPEAEDFLKLLAANQNRIYAYILTLVPNWHEADDLMQNTITIMWRKFNTFIPETDFVAWGIRIARYEINNYRKKQHKKQILFNDDLLKNIQERTDKLDSQKEERLAAMQKCVKKLGEHDRHLIQLRYEEDMNIKKMSDRVGKSVHSLYKTLARIHTILLSCIKRTLAAEGTA